MDLQGTLPASPSSSCWNSLTRAGLHLAPLGRRAHEQHTQCLKALAVSRTKEKSPNLRCWVIYVARLQKPPRSSVLTAARARDATAGRERADRERGDALLALCLSLKAEGRVVMYFQLLILCC